MPELRKDPVVERWVIIAKERGRRPTQPSAAAELPVSPNNPFCWGNEDRTPPEVFAVRRDGSSPNTPGWTVRVVPNRFPALQVEGDLDRRAYGRYDLMNGIGAHEVIIESPDPEAELSDLPPEHVADVVTAYIERLKDLRRDLRLRYHMIYRNQGLAAGANIRHPHSQLIATPIIPTMPKAKLDACLRHYRTTERNLYADIIHWEEEQEVRVVSRTDHFIVLAPYASRFPFELAIYPLRQCHDLPLITAAERLDFAVVLLDVLGRLKRALDNPPYNYMLFTAPSLTPRPGRPDFWGTIPDDFRWHLEIVPRLQQTAGFEWGTGFYINPVAPEEAAQFLREST
ncbi:MAG: galactose-1-phosphate uridylyltransferase [Armatimonadetes bacterium]|nr:galactose-1-phosphate uridylyltransferase [Armatimonadota bacterium]